MGSRAYPTWDPESIPGGIPPSNCGIPTGVMIHALSHVKSQNFNMGSFSWKNSLDILFLIGKESCCFLIKNTFRSSTSYDLNTILNTPVRASL